MKLNEYLDARDLELDIKRYPNQKERWIARLADCEIAEHGCLISAYGNGNSAEEAIRSYIERVQGKRLVQHAMHATMRQEFTVPLEIEL